MTRDGAAPSRYAVIGNPVEHSLSPRIHAAFAHATGEALQYGTIAAPEDGFAAATERFFADGGAGLNVTLPFKLDAWRWVDSHDDAAGEAEAVNTIVPKPERAGREGRPSMHGCNTDGVGLVRDLEANLGWRLAGARTLVLGAGGAVQGVLGPLKRAGVAELTIANRTRAKAERLAQRFGVASCDLTAAGGGWDVVVNGTSVGVGASTGSALSALIPSEAIAGSRCYDMVYALDGATPFCRWAAEQGAAETSDGLGMLVEQGAEAFFLWRGKRPDTAAVLGELGRS